MFARAWLGPALVARPNGCRAAFLEHKFIAPILLVASREVPPCGWLGPVPHYSYRAVPGRPLNSRSKDPMKKTVLGLALVLAGSSLAVGLGPTDANAGARKFCKEAVKTHPMAGEPRDVMKRCRAAYKAHRKAGYARPT
jgi:hypothetical protein